MISEQANLVGSNYPGHAIVSNYENSTLCVPLWTASPQRGRPRRFALPARTVLDYRHKYGQPLPSDAGLMGG